MTVVAACGSDDAVTTGTDMAGGTIVPLEAADSTVDTDPGTSTVTVFDEPAGTTAATTVATTSAASTAPAVPTPAATQPVAAAARCLIGDWRIADGDVAAYMGRSASSVFDDVVASGQLTLSFTASNYTWTQSARIAFTVDYDTGPTPATFSQDRVITGSWTATSSTISATNLSNNGDYVITENGVEPGDTGDLFLGILPYDPVDGMTYSCDGPTLDLRLSDFSADTMTVTLQPR